MIELTRRRMAKGWSKSELARRAKMTASDVGRIESRRLIPYESQCRKLAKALGIPARDTNTLMEEVTTNKS